MDAARSEQLLNRAAFDFGGLGGNIDAGSIFLTRKTRVSSRAVVSRSPTERTPLGTGLDTSHTRTMQQSHTTPGPRAQARVHPPRPSVMTRLGWGLHGFRVGGVVLAVCAASACA